MGMWPLPDARCSAVRPFALTDGAFTLALTRSRRFIMVKSPSWRLLGALFGRPTRHSDRFVSPEPCGGESIVNASEAIGIKDTKQTMSISDEVSIRDPYTHYKVTYVTAYNITSLIVLEHLV